MEENEKLTCKKCQTTMDSKKNFYTKRNGEKTDLCKRCLTMHLNVFDESTYLWLMELIDIPYIPEEWTKIIDTAYAKDPTKMDSTAIFGKYLSKMKLIQFKNKSYADTEEILAKRQEKRDAAAKEAEVFDQEMKNRYERGEISEAEYKTYASTAFQDAETPPKAPYSQASAFYNESAYLKEEDLIDPAEGLTQEDKIYLAMKWGRLYKPAEWLSLEREYNEMNNTFSINDPDTKNTVMFICKTSLKMHQALDMGDVETYQKLSRVYDQMRKSAKLTAIQNKKEDNKVFDSIGELVAFCELHGKEIPRYDISVPLDKVDIIISDLKNYTKSLIYADTTLSAQIEDYLKRREIADEELRQKKMNGDKTPEIILSDNDYAKHFNQIEEDLEQDEEVYNEQ